MSVRTHLLRTLGGIAVLGASLLALTGCEGGGAQPVPGGSSAGPDPQPFALAVGDCVAAEEAGPEGAPTPGPGGAPLQSLPVVPCDQPHALEVFASFSLAEGPFPGDALVTDAANDGCLAEFEAFIGLPPHKSELHTSSLFPTQSSWLTGDREVLCLVGDPEGPATGSLHGVQR